VVDLNKILKKGNSYSIGKAERQGRIGSGFFAAHKTNFFSFQQSAVFVTRSEEAFISFLGKNFRTFG
jgi:hypothetical protein